MPHQQQQSYLGLYPFASLWGEGEDQEVEGVEEVHLALGAAVEHHNVRYVTESTGEDDGVALDCN